MTMTVYMNKSIAGWIATAGALLTLAFGANALFGENGSGRSLYDHGRARAYEKQIERRLLEAGVGGDIGRLTTSDWEQYVCGPLGYAAAQRTEQITDPPCGPFTGNDVRKIRTIYPQ